MFKGSIKENIEGNKHIPYIEITDKNKVSIRCGKDAMHPTTESHYIGWIKLYGLKEKVLMELGVATFWPGLAEPVAHF